MKTHVKLLVLAMVLVMFAFCLAACGGNGGTTTTEAPTTEAPVVTTTEETPAGYDPAAFDVVVSNNGTVGYTGAALNVVTVKKPSGIRTDIKYATLDADGNVVGEFTADKPVDCGKYRVTVTFSWQSASKTDPLPAPMSKDFTVVAGELAKQHANFGAKDSETLFKTTNMNYNPLEDENLIVGSVPKGVVRNATIVKLLSETDTGAGTPVTTPGKITTADGAGYYRVTITYAEETGKDNFSDEATLSDTAVVYARPIDKVATRVDANAIGVDGEIDGLYGAPVFETRYQAHTTKQNSAGEMVFDKIDLTEGVFVNPYQYAALMQISKGSAIEDPEACATAKFYAVWDGTYVYVAIEVTDTTNYARTATYTSKPNPWINDSVELYYHFGGDNVPSLAGERDTYPVYKTVVRDSLAASSISGIKSQKSHYWDEIVCAVSERGIGDNTYVIEYKFPAKSEGYSGTPGATGDQAYKTNAGTALAAGDFIYLAYQINDLTALPYKRLNTNNEYDSLNGTLSTTERWASATAYDALISGFQGNKYKDMDYGTAPEKDSEWYNFEFDAAAYVYSAGNRGPSAYLGVEGCAPMIIALGN